MKKRLIGLISAVEFESSELLKKLKNQKRITRGVITYYRGKIQEREVVMAVSGAGKVNAAVSAAIMAEIFKPYIIINFGIGGAYPGSGLTIGTIAIAEKEIYADEGLLTGRGFMGMEFVGIELVPARKGRSPLYNEIPLNHALVSKIEKLLKRTGYNIKKGPFLTVSTITGTTERALYLRRRFRGICENMEGAAIAHVCRVQGIDFLEIRAISNIVEDRDRRKWRLKEAAAKCQDTVLSLLKIL